MSASTRFEKAYDIASDHFDTFAGQQYIFVTDGKDGYLFADLNQNDLVDTAIILEGLNEKTDFDFWNIVVDLKNVTTPLGNSRAESDVLYRLLQS